MCKRWYLTRVIASEFLACREYENEIGTGTNNKVKRDTIKAEVQFNIYSGTITEHGEFPYMVALGYENDEKDDDNSEAIKYNCGGTLISSQYVLTAAHCVSNIQEKVPIEVGNKQTPSSRLRLIWIYHWLWDMYNTYEDPGEITRK